LGLVSNILFLLSLAVLNLNGGGIWLVPLFSFSIGFYLKALQSIDQRINTLDLIQKTTILYFIPHLIIINPITISIIIDIGSFITLKNQMGEWYNITNNFIQSSSSIICNPGLVTTIEAAQTYREVLSSIIGQAGGLLGSIPQSPVYLNPEFMKYIEYFCQYIGYLPDLNITIDLLETHKNLCEDLVNLNQTLDPNSLKGLPLKEIFLFLGLALIFII